MISKKKILLIKARETQKVHGIEQWKKETTIQKQPLIYSNRRNKIRKVEQSEKPQYRDQSKRVLWQNSNN